jgi:hypothetical protein
LNALETVHALIEAKEYGGEMPLRVHISNDVLAEIKQEAQRERQQRAAGRLGYFELGDVRALWGTPVTVTARPGWFVEVEC